jgi:hypothetical protein
MKKLLLLLFLIPNLVMAEKWIPIVTDEDDWEFFYDEESMRNNKDGTYSLVMKAFDNYSEEYIRKDKKK